MLHVESGLPWPPFHHATVETHHRSAASSGPGTASEVSAFAGRLGEVDPVSRVPCPVLRGHRIESNRLFARPLLQPTATSGYNHTYVHTVSAQHLRARAGHHLISSHLISPNQPSNCERKTGHGSCILDHACNVLVVVGQSVSHMRHREVREREPEPERQNTLFNFNHPFCVAILDAYCIPQLTCDPATQRPRVGRLTKQR